MIFCSTIIPTVARASLDRTVRSVLDQSFTAAGFEVIVVNDSGQPLPDADWQHSQRVCILDTNRLGQSVAENTGAATARGKYLHFLDDDDWLLPGALASFWQLSRDSAAPWLYGNSQLVDRQGKPLIQLAHGLEGNCFVQIMAGEWIPLQASLIAAETFFAAGGFNPLMRESQDIDLERRVALHSDLATTGTVVACISRGDEGSTYDYHLFPRYGRWARERVLNEAGAFARMRASSTSSYWHGRVARIYFTSVVWNLEHRRLFSAASRMLFGIASVILALHRLPSASYWGALSKGYDSPTFSRGLQEEMRRKRHTQ